MKQLDCIRQLTKAIDQVQDDIERMKTHSQKESMSQLIEVLPHLRVAMAQLKEARLIIESVNTKQG